jgi:hypothetical protein
MLVDFARLSVLPQQPPQDTLTPHPEHLRWHARLGRSLSLTRAGVPPLPLRRQQCARASARVDGRGLDDDVALLDQLLYMRTAVGVPDLRLLGGVEPDFALPDALDGGGEAFLGTEINCILGLLGEKKKGETRRTHRPWWVWGSVSKGRRKETVILTLRM